MYTLILCKKYTTRIWRCEVFQKTDMYRIIKKNISNIITINTRWKTNEKQNMNLENHDILRVWNYTDRILNTISWGERN